jgi:hypothetical protein
MEEEILEEVAEETATEVEEAPEETAVEIEEAPEETHEQREARFLRERKKQALIDRKDIIERNGGNYEEQTSVDGSEIDAQCCP